MMGNNTFIWIVKPLVWGFYFYFYPLLSNSSERYDGSHLFYNAAGDQQRINEMAAINSFVSFYYCAFSIISLHFFIELYQKNKQIYHSLLFLLSAFCHAFQSRWKNEGAKGNDPIESIVRALSTADATGKRQMGPFTAVIHLPVLSCSWTLLC